MANKQTLPGMVDTQKRYVQADTSPQIPQISWKSPLRDVSNLMNETNEFAETYSKLRYDEYEAKYNNMATQMFHEMDDATDPCQLQEIKNKYDTEFNKPLDNTVWAKSYNNSRYKRSWIDGMNLNYEKKYIQKMHEFTAIQLDRTLNEMSSAAALTGDVRSAASFFDSGINAIGNTKHMDIEVRDKMQKQFATDFIGKLYTRDPNFALSFVNQAESGLAKYGIDVNKIRRDAEQYNSQKANDEWQAYQRAKTIQSDMNTAKEEYYKAQIVANPEKTAEIQKEALKYDNGVGVNVSEFIRKRQGSSTSPTGLQVGLSEAAKKGKEEYEKYVKNNFAEIAMDSKARSTRDDLDKEFGIKREQGENDEIKYKFKNNLESRYVNGEKIDIAKEDKNIKDLNISEKQKNELYNTLSSIAKAQKEAETKKNDANIKETSKSRLNDANIAISNSSDDKTLLNIYDTYAKELTEDDRGTLIDKISAKIENLKKEGKLNNESAKKLKQDIRYTQLLNSNDYLSPKELENLVSNEEIRVEQATALKNNQDKRLEEENKLSKESRIKEVFKKAYLSSEKGVIFDYKLFEDDLSQDDILKLHTLNLNTQKNKYTAELSKIVLQHMGNVVPEDMQRQDILALTKIAPYGTNVEEDYKKKFQEIGNVDESILNNVKSKVDLYFTPIGLELTDYEQQQKYQAVNEILTKARDKGISDAEIMTIINKYKPSAEQLRQHGINQTSARYLIDNQKDKIFLIGETKIEDDDTTYKTSSISLNKDATFGNLRNYEMTVQDSYNKGFITKSEYEEYMRPLMAAYEPIVKETLANPDTVIGDMAVRLKNFLYPKTDDFDLFPSEIKDYQDFYNNLNEIAANLEMRGVPLDKEKTLGYKIANLAREVFGGNVSIDGDFISSEAIFYEYISKKYSNYDGGNIIK